MSLRILCAVLFLALCVSTVHAQYDPDDYDYELDYADYFDIYGPTGEYLSTALPSLSSYESGSGGQKKGALQSLSLPLLSVTAPLQTAKTLEMPRELHTQKTIQPVLQSRTIMQPVIQQRLIEQPILRTTTVKQPHHKWIETQPIVQPKIVQNTRIVRQYQEQPIVVPKLQEHSKTVNTYQSKPRTLQTITNKAQVETRPVVQTKQHLPALQAINTNPGLMQSLGLNPDANMLLANLQQQQDASGGDYMNSFQGQDMPMQYGQDTTETMPAQIMQGQGFQQF